MFNHYFQDIDARLNQSSAVLSVDELKLLQEIQVLLESLASDRCDHSVNVCSCFERQCYEYLTSYIKHLEAQKAVQGKQKKERGCYLLTFARTSKSTWIVSMREHHQNERTASTKPMGLTR